MERSSAGSSVHRHRNNHSSSSVRSHNSHQRHHQQQQRTQERGVDLICRVKYGNTLPDLPFEPKFLQSPFISLNRFITYKPSSLEKNFKYELLTEPDLNVKIDLINPMTYHCDPEEDKPPLDPVDEQLLEDESISQLNTRRSIQHRKVVPWMRKTEYISTEFNRYGIGQTGAERPDTKIGYGMKKRIKEEDFEYKDRESQISAIQRTFAEVQTPLKAHYRKPGVTAVEEFPVFPDFDLWKYPFAQVIFDADPLPYCKENREQKLDEAIMRGMADMEGNQFVGYFAPIEEALEQRMADDREEFGSYKEGMEYHYKLEREYNWTVQHKATKGYKQENYFLVRRGPAFYYNELDTRVKLARRGKSVASAKNTILSITNRQMTSKEASTMTNRANQLFGIQEEEEEEEEEEEKEEEKEVKAEEEMEEDEAESKGNKSEDKEEERTAGKRKKLKSSSEEEEEEEESEEGEEEEGKKEEEKAKGSKQEKAEEKTSEEESSESEEEESSEEEEEE